LARPFQLISTANSINQHQLNSDSINLKFSTAKEKEDEKLSKEEELTPYGNVW
jgi:hypothetical protein